MGPKESAPSRQATANRRSVSLQQLSSASSFPVLAAFWRFHFPLEAFQS
jgi:hypothetical protein